MMWIAECNLDERGRLTLPKSFLKANELNKFTKVYIQTMYNSEDTVKLVFCNHTNKELWRLLLFLRSE